MKLYEIPNELERMIDPETGEITDEEEFLALVDRYNNGKEWVALMYKNFLSEAEALKKEKEVFATRERVSKNKAERLKNYLDYLCRGEKFSTDKVQVSYRKSKVVEVDDEFITDALESEDLSRFIRYKDPEVDKTALKEAMKVGFEFEHARIVEKNNIQIR